MDSTKKPTFTAAISVPVPLLDGAIDVRTAKMGPLLAAKALLIPVLRRLADDSPEVFDAERLELIAATRMITARDVQDFCLLAEEADIAVDLVATLAPMDKAKVLDLHADEFFFLLAVVVQVNVDFFYQALSVFKDAAQRVGPAWRAAQGTQTSNGTGSSPTPSTA